MTRDRALRFFPVLLVMILIGCTSAPARETTATVVSIVPKTSRTFGAAVAITVRSADGLVGMTDVDTRELSCRVGDTVNAEVQGVALRIVPGSCRRSAGAR